MMTRRRRWNRRPDAGNAGDTCMATPTSTQRPYRLPASYATYSDQALGSPQSIHTDTDTVMEFNPLQVAARSAPPQGPARNVPPQGRLKN